MQNHVGWLWIAGLVGFVVAADAQTASPPASATQFDGTYAFVSSTNVNGGKWPGQCPERKAESLIIAQGQAQYSSRRVDGTARLKLEGAVGSQGALAMRRESEPEGRHGGINPGLEFFAHGRIDGNGTARVHQIGYSCSFEFSWQKKNK